MESKGADGLSLRQPAYSTLRTSLSIEVSVFQLKVLNYSSLTIKKRGW
ncbi:hypothetical protein IRB23SM22_21030 [Alkalibacterium sp. s-m-22]